MTGVGIVSYQLEVPPELSEVPEPTKYYSVEGSNVYFELQHNGESIDPVGFFE